MLYVLTGEVRYVMSIGYKYDHTCYTIMQQLRYFLTVIEMGFNLKPVAVLMLSTLTLLANGEPQVPCYFVFGDSLMDNGNNNYLVTQAKVNYPPYGIDFPDGPTGRFSNGRNIADVIAELLGFKSYIPPFATANGEQIISGVNYASGAAGILEETGQHMGARISLDKQIQNHWITILRLSYLIGKGSLATTKKYLNECIYTIGMGNNDYINNYFAPKYYKTSTLYTPEQYAEVLIEQYSKQLQALYKYGARKFGIFAAGYTGCTPGMMKEYGVNSCVDSVNYAVILFNTLLNATLNDLNNKYADAKFIIIDSPLGYSNDLNVTDVPCCEVSSTYAKGNCAPNQIPCSNRENYVFWDAYHPTEKVSIIDGTAAYETLSPLYSSEIISSSTDNGSGYISDI
ncbi:SGNH hydrolase-type esterase domain-containing protein [Artemisia annua]|uniref:SGNH hydrolase-type esterase domain-containing protein n=1 Tax=Artemisia annua TaxID=35608 RepID=A0A2U1Q753_ARTAN|nr:SGNH hydrolase-type esterase domain-containing protein [Artemisia annua]